MIVRWLLRSLAQALRQPYTLTFLRLLYRYGQQPRFQPQQAVQCNGLRLQLVDGPSFVWQYQEIFRDEIYRFPPGDAGRELLIYDCGANIGCSALWFFRHYANARIVAFEADAEVFACLQHNILANGAADRVLCRQQAVWVHDDGVNFAADGADGGSIAGGGRPVPSVRLARLLQAEQHVDLLKLDIEGAETAVIVDCASVLDRVQHLFIEYHARPGSPQTLAELLQVLQQQGFRYYISTVAPRARPFVDHGQQQAMDLQLNIFGYRG